MKHSITLLFLSVLLFFSACGKDDEPGKNGNYDSANEWIETSMRNQYFWYEDIPAKGELNMNLSPEDFFDSLLSDKDGKTNSSGSHFYFSTIEKKNTTKTYYGDRLSLGFEYQSWLFTQTQTYAVNILYTLPNSPAAKKGLKRGDWITTINDAPVSASNLSELRESGSIKLGISSRPSGNPETQVTLTPEMVLDNPVYLDTIFDTNTMNVPEPAKNKKIGYLVYNHFTTGPESYSDETFNNDLRNAFARFKNGNLDDFILDLRYNMGGVITSAQLLATMLAPASALEGEFCHLIYNDKQTSKNHTIKLSKEYMKRGANGENLDMKRLFVITSSRTASASEAVINGLKPYLGNTNIVLIGEQTMGKNVGSVQIENTNFDYKLHPIVCRIFNKDNESDYENGFTPTFTYREEDTAYPLGDTRDLLLNISLQYVLFGGIQNTLQSKTTQDTECIPVSCSLDRRKTNGVLLSGIE